MFYVYILRSTKYGGYYIGHTSDLNQRLLRHNSGKNRSTKPGRPWKVIYTESLATKNDAYKREMQIKSYKGGRAFRQLLEP